MGAPQQPWKYAEEIRTVSVSFVRKLEPGEVLTGSPQVTPVGDIVVGQIWINPQALVINGEHVPAGMAVQFSISAGTPGQLQDIWLLADTSATPAQTIAGRIQLRVI